MAEPRRCPCSGTLLSITVAENVRLDRCLACGAQVWLVDGAEVIDRAELDARLRNTFAERRNTGPRRPRRPRVTSADVAHVIDLRGGQDPQPVAPDGPPPAELLQAMLGSLFTEKGLGDWRLSS